MILLCQRCLARLETSTVKTEKPVRKRPKQDPRRPLPLLKLAHPLHLLKSHLRRTRRISLLLLARLWLNLMVVNLSSLPSSKSLRNLTRRQLLLLPQFSPKIPMWMCGAGHYSGHGGVYVGPHLYRLSDVVSLMYSPQGQVLFFILFLPSSKRYFCLGHCRMYYVCGRRMLCQHKEPLAACTNCRSWVTAPVGCPLMTCRRFVITCCRLRKPRIPISLG